MEHSYYEDIHRAKQDVPYVDTGMTDIEYRAHYHEEIEIVVMLDGLVSMTVDGRCVELHGGDVALVRPFQIHSLMTPLHSRLYIIKLLCSQFDFSAVERDETVLSPSDADYTAVFDCIHRLVEEHGLGEDDPLRPLALRCAADHLLLHMARLPGLHPVTRDSRQAHDRDVELLRTLNDYLALHYRESIPLEVAAGVCHMSMYYFSHAFKRATGTTFTSYLNGYRLEQAMPHVTDTDEPFINIAMQCGFPTIRTFNRCFQKQYRITPSEARRRARLTTDQERTRT